VKSLRVVRLFRIGRTGLRGTVKFEKNLDATHRRRAGDLSAKNVKGVEEVPAEAGGKCGVAAIQLEWFPL